MRIDRAQIIMNRRCSLSELAKGRTLGRSEGRVPSRIGGCDAFWCITAKTSQPYRGSGAAVVVVVVVVVVHNIFLPLCVITSQHSSSRTDATTTMESPLNFWTPSKQDTFPYKQQKQQHWIRIATHRAHSYSGYYWWATKQEHQHRRVPLFASAFVFVISHSVLSVCLALGQTESCTEITIAVPHSHPIGQIDLVNCWLHLTRHRGAGCAGYVCIRVDGWSHVNIIGW